MGKRSNNPNDQRACTAKNKVLKKESPKPTKSKKRQRHPEYRRLFCDTIQNHMIINVAEFKLNHEWKGSDGLKQPELYTFLKKQKGKQRGLAAFYIVFQNYEKDFQGKIKGPKYLQQCAHIFQAYEKQISEKQLSPQQVARQKELLKQVLKLSRLNEFRYLFNLNLQPSQPAIRLNDSKQRLRVVRKDPQKRYKGSKNFHKLIKQFKGKQLYDNRVQASRQYIRFVSFWKDLTNDPFQNMPEPIVADNEAEQTDMLQHQSGHNQNDNMSTEGQLNQSSSTAIINEAQSSTMSSVAMNRFDENNKKIEQKTFDGKDDWTTGGWKKCLQP